MSGFVTILYWLTGVNNHQLWRLWSQTLGFVIIPATYILNRDVTKQIIVLENWYTEIISALSSTNKAEALVEAKAAKISRRI